MFSVVWSAQSQKCRAQVFFFASSAVLYEWWTGSNRESGYDLYQGTVLNSHERTAENYV
jgi:hypothetical protein